MNVPPPPPPPPLATIKAPIPVTNKALLSSIEKGTKLKKVPESLRNDRSTVVGAPSSSGSGRTAASQKRSVNGAPPQLPMQSKPAIPMNRYSSIQNELASQMSAMSGASPNVRKVAPVTLPLANASHSRGAPIRGSVPPPNQFPAAAIANKPPPPPPLNKKPNMAATRHSISEAVSPMSAVRGHCDPVHSQAPVMRKVQAPPPHQTNSINMPLHPKPQVSRVTSNPPPPLPNALRESPKVCPPTNGAPPVPHRVVSQPSVGRPQLMKSKPAPPTAASSYNVSDRPPPPTPGVAASNQKSLFDQRFKFPDEGSFPNSKGLANMASSKSRVPSGSRGGHLEMNSY